jgi:hypothetical protein
MNFHTEGMEASQIEALRLCGKAISERQFYLAGGTALAIYYGHRQSLDLDWFSTQFLTEPLLLAKALKDTGIPFVTEKVEAGTLVGKIKGVWVSFMEYTYSLLQPLVQWEEMSCSLASLDDLACMKLAAVAQRGSKKDFIDLYVLATHHRSLPEMLALYQKRYQVEDVTPVIYGLTYFEDAESELSPRLLWKTDWKTVKKTIKDMVRGVSLK